MVNSSKDTYRRIEQALQRIYQVVRADYLFVATVDLTSNVATSVCLINDGEPSENFSYSLDNTPCKDVTDTCSVLIRSAVQEAFPKDKDLQVMGVDGYIGESLRDEDGELLGILVGLFKKPIQDPALAGTLFSALAGYMTSELKRIEEAFQLTAVSTKVDNMSSLMREIELISLTGGWQVDLVNNDFTWTPGTYAIHGMSEQEVLDPATAIMFYEQDDQEIIANAFKQLCDYGKPYALELKITDAKGQKKWIKTTGNAKRNEKGEVVLVYGAIEDISAEKHLLQREKDRTRAFASTLNALHDAVITIDSKGIIINCNSTTSELLGYESKELVGNNVSMIMPEKDAVEHDEYIKRHLKTGINRVIGIERELFAKHKNGNEIPIELSLSRVYENNELHFVGIISDITERKENESKLKFLALKDKVTRLPNINSFEMSLTKMLRDINPLHDDIYLAILDITRFSEINHAYGSDVGNEVLQRVAERIVSQMDSSLQLFRYLSDTFVILHRQPIDKQNEVVKRRLLKQEMSIKEVVAQDMDISGNKHNISLCFASGVFDGGKITLEGIDPLLNFIRSQAKQLPDGDTFHMSSEKLALFELQRNIQRCMLDSLRKNEFHLVLQPKFDVLGNIHSSEALLRWIHPEYGFISPGVFIPIAEQNGDILHLFRWVLKEVCTLLQKIQVGGVNTKVSINVSGRDIVQQDFVSIVKSTLSEYSINPRSIIFEITETTLIKDVESVKSRMQELSALGHQFSIDDFGTGYSSFKYLDSLPIQELKIDQYFVSKIGESSQLNIIDSIVGMAKMLGLMTVAEGVETAEQANYLKEIGCELLQGYHLSKPLESEKWEKLVTTNHSDSMTG